MDAEGCVLPFTQSELERCLGQAQLELLDRLRSEKAIEGAMIEGLAKCPYCPWAVVIEDPGESHHYAMQRSAEAQRRRQAVPLRQRRVHARLLSQVSEGMHADKVHGRC